MITVKYVIKGREYFETFNNSEDSSNFIRRLLKTANVSYIESFDNISGFYMKHLINGLSI